MNRITEPDSIQLAFASNVKELVLASRSENRRALLERAGIRVHQRPMETEELKIGSTAEEKVLNIAKMKMDAYLESEEFIAYLPAISADTLVLFRGSLIGKAKTREEARNALSSFSGNRQEVITACSLYVPGKARIDFTDKAEVLFRKLDGKEIESYLDTGDWIEAAGSYRLQRNGWTIVESISGDWTTVVGLPLGKLTAYMSSL